MLQRIDRNLTGLDKIVGRQFFSQSISGIGIFVGYKSRKQ